MILQFLLMHAVLTAVVILAWVAWMRASRMSRTGEVGATTLAAVDGRTRHDTLRATAHDLRNILNGASTSVAAAQSALPADARQLLTTARETLQSAHAVIGRYLAPVEPQDRPTPMSEILRLTIELLDPSRRMVSLRIAEDFVVDGATSAQRIAVNLVSNALAAVADVNTSRPSDGHAARRPAIDVEITADGFSISNSVGDATRLGGDIWEAGVSRSGSTGQGLTIVLAACETLHWAAWHEVHDDRVTFFVSRTPRLLD